MEDTPPIIPGTPQAPNHKAVTMPPPHVGLVHETAEKPKKAKAKKKAAKKAATKPAAPKPAAKPKITTKASRRR